MSKKTSQNKISRWEFISHKGKCAGWADYVTARCASCKEPLYCNPNKFMGRTEEDKGTVIFSGFFVSVPDSIKQSVIEEAAESRRKDLPKYCACCGAEMSDAEDEIPF